MGEPVLEHAMKKGSAELLILAVLEAQPRHGYELTKQITVLSKGVLTFHAASLYPLLIKLEERGLIAGRWVEKSGQRRRRYYRMTPEGRDVLEAQRRSWKQFFEAINRVAKVLHA